LEQPVEPLAVGDGRVLPAIGQGPAGRHIQNQVGGTVYLKSLQNWRQARVANPTENISYLVQPGRTDTISFQKGHATAIRVSGQVSTDPGQSGQSFQDTVTVCNKNTYIYHQRAVPEFLLIV
jgi:hypothetical protein